MRTISARLHLILLYSIHQSALLFINLLFNCYVKLNIEIFMQTLTISKNIIVNYELSNVLSNLSRTSLFGVDPIHMIYIRGHVDRAHKHPKSRTHKFSVFANVED